ncbi:MAG: SIMPL domain-containing protein [Chloroflexota bacterium]
MKSFPNTLNVILTGILVFVLVTLGLPQWGARAATPVPESTEQAATCDYYGRNVAVSGRAVINVVPDRVLIQLGVQSNGVSPAEVQRRNTSAIERVKAAIQALGVAASDITSDNYIIEPLYEDYDSLYIKGYRINNVLAVTLRKVEKASDLIAAAFGAGANQVVNVEFYTSDLRTYRDQARLLAMEAAVQKAEALAEAAGAEVGCVLSISENSWSYYSGWYYGYGNSQILWAQNVVQNAPTTGGGEGADEGPVSPGHISVQAEVFVSFDLD